MKVAVIHEWFPARPEPADKVRAKESASLIMRRVPALQRPGSK